MNFEEIQQFLGSVERFVVNNVPALVVATMVLALVALLLIALYRAQGAKIVLLIPYWLIGLLVSLAVAAVVGVARLAGRDWGVPEWTSLESRQRRRARLERQRSLIHRMDLTRGWNPQRKQAEVLLRRRIKR